MTMRWDDGGESDLRAATHDRRVSGEGGRREYDRPTGERHRWTYEKRAAIERHEAARRRADAYERALLAEYVTGKVVH